MSVEASFVDAVAHNVARQPSFGDSDGYNFDITYKAHVSPGILLFRGCSMYFIYFEVFHSINLSLQQPTNNFIMKFVCMTQLHSWNSTIYSRTLWITWKGKKLLAAYTQWIIQDHLHLKSCIDHHWNMSGNFFWSWLSRSFLNYITFYFNSCAYFKESTPHWV